MVKAARRRGGDERCPEVQLCRAALCLLHEKPLSELWFYKGECHALDPCPCGAASITYVLSYKQCRTCMRRRLVQGYKLSRQWEDWAHLFFAS